VSNDGSNIVHEMKKVHQLCFFYKGTESKRQLRSNDTFWDAFPRLFGSRNGQNNSLFGVRDSKKALLNTNTMVGEAGG
jgi:hypothetical protein